MGSCWACCSTVDPWSWASTLILNDPWSKASCSTFCLSMILGPGPSAQLLILDPGAAAQLFLSTILDPGPAAQLTWACQIFPPNNSWLWACSLTFDSWPWGGSYPAFPLNTFWLWASQFFLTMRSSFLLFNDWMMNAPKLRVLYCSMQVNVPGECGDLVALA